MKNIMGFMLFAFVFSHCDRGIGDVGPDPIGPNNTYPGYAYYSGSGDPAFVDHDIAVQDTSSGKDPGKNEDTVGEDTKAPVCTGTPAFCACMDEFFQNKNFCDCLENAGLIVGANLSEFFCQCCFLVANQSTPNWAATWQPLEESCQAFGYTPAGDCSLL